MLASLLQMVTDDKRPVNLADVKQRSILTILKDSLKDSAKGERGKNEVRYKLIIDPSEDSSVVRLLFRFGVLQRSNTRIYICSNFPGDNELHKVSGRRRKRRRGKLMPSLAQHLSHIYV